MSEEIVNKNEEAGNKTTEVKLSQEICTKHPLQNTWELWYYKVVSNDFEKNLFTVTSVSTVEDFWGLYNHIEFPTKLNTHCAYYFFKKGIRPMWEDSTNKDGGRWLINNKKSNSDATENFWLEILLCLIGEAFGEFNDHICGAFILVKPKQDRVGVWTKVSSDRESNIHIGKVIKSRIQYNGTLSYEPHDSSRKNCYQI